LSAGTDYQKDSEGKAKAVQVVNLLVTPEQAELLSLASNQVRIQLVLRNPLDTKVAAVAGTATSNLFTGPVTSSSKSLIAKKSAPRFITIKVLNGSKQTEEKFSSPGGHQ
jgi:pilus assembly protein CpaB